MISEIAHLLTGVQESIGSTPALWMPPRGL